jgi:hypothetical protein
MVCSPGKMIKKIIKGLEKIPEKKEQISYLVKELNKTKDKELKEQIQKLIEEVIKEESLEERIDLKQPQLDVPQRKFEAPTLAAIPAPEKKEEKTEIQEVNYTSIIQNYHTQVEEVREILGTEDPTRRDILSDLNISRTKSIRPYMEAPEDRIQGQYKTSREDQINFQTETAMTPGSMDILDILRRKKQEHQKLNPKYELR